MVNETLSVKFVMLLSGILASLLFLYLILFTNYAPDFYVFVQYAYLDNTTRNLTIESVTSNNFLFDAMIVFGDLLSFDAPIHWILFASTLSLLYFLAKYSLLLGKARVFGVFLVYLVCFFVDLNQLRFGISTLLLFSSFWIRTPPLKYLFITISFLVHIVPLFIFFLSKFFRFGIGALFFVPLFPILCYFLLSHLSTDFIEYSRVFAYLTDPVEGTPKILVVIFPVLFYMFNYKFHDTRLNKIFDFAFASMLIGFAFLFLNINLTARFFEISFMTVAVLNSFQRIGRLYDFFIFVLAVGIIASRLYYGINHSTDFSYLYSL